MNMLLLEKCLDTLDIKVTHLHYVNFVTIHILLFQHFPLCMDITVSDLYGSTSGLADKHTTTADACQKAGGCNWQT